MFSNAATHHSHRVTADLKHLLLLQAQARTLQLPSARRALRQRRGGHHSVMRGRGMSLAEVRPYQPGDDVRRIDWRVTARRQEPHTRVYEEERERPVLILCDLGASLFFASEGSYKQVRAAELSALLAWVAHGSGDQAGGIVFGGDTTEIIRPSRRRRSVMQLLNALAAHQRTQPGVAPEPAGEGLNEALTEARRIVHTGSRVFVISDFQGADSDTRSLLASLATHNQVTAVRLTDPLDDQLPDHGDYAVSGAAGTLWFNGDDRALQKAWREGAQARHTALETLVRQTGCSLMTLATGEDPVALMHGLTSAGGRLL
ncbi:DUF58 domain-containing protein [Marinobacter zhanjiangensis]|uniref:DUF58 domain-containing protein n=1 Tax=Marinobacter zhanjiangensis TaxID=578215 RepID=A0ABQ3APQ7_9GAMM|nr:DUF58 domain-containing protein [Marinobacter zhanjiangensis]GGY63948.1 hypothetical protein GCM10007071_08210 [Marinobacter zhanjiangensis]